MQQGEQHLSAIKINIFAARKGNAAVILLLLLTCELWVFLRFLYSKVWPFHSVFFGRFLSGLGFF
jgi:hypothetical protein